MAAIPELASNVRRGTGASRRVASQLSVRSVSPERTRRKGKDSTWVGCRLHAFDRSSEADERVQISLYKDCSDRSMKILTLVTTISLPSGVRSKCTGITSKIVQCGQNRVTRKLQHAACTETEDTPGSDIPADNRSVVVQNNHRCVACAASWSDSLLSPAHGSARLFCSDLFSARICVAGARASNTLKTSTLPCRIVTAGHSI